VHVIMQIMIIVNVIELQFVQFNVTK